MPAKKKAKVVTQEKYAPPDLVIPKRLGGGVLKIYFVREVPSGVIVHYALAYINHLICNADNGRVLGYDNSHGYSHRHYMNEKIDEPFTTYNEIYEKFMIEWRQIAMDFVKGSRK